MGKETMERDSASGSDHEKTPLSRPTRKTSFGAFKTMDLLSSVLKGIQRKGYCQPTPIQRKCIPLLLAGGDVVGMARTGSGKTAAFVIPMLHKLKTHSAKTGARALLLAPSRELAMQTFTFVKQMAKYTDLRATVLVGGDSMEEQFGMMTANPDIIVATPGRLLHLCIETKLELKTVEYVIFDEADRLFEMGFAEQLNEIMARLPSSRQTALFSATLPKSLVDFANAGLSEPTLVRLDVDTKVSPDLKVINIAIKSESRTAALLHLLKHVIDPKHMTVVFVSTKHHVEYLQELLVSTGMSVAYVYGALDQVARKQAMDRFRSGQCHLLIVTDVAARGIDIPLLDNVINFDFPARPKWFIHRVGRVARAGRIGTAYSLVATDELPFLVDLQLFLGGSLTVEKDQMAVEPNYAFGVLLQEWIDLEEECLVKLHHVSTTLDSLKGVVINAYKFYRRTRPTASPESYQRAKELLKDPLPIHPAFLKEVNMEKAEQISMLAAMQQYRPRQAVFDMPGLIKPANKAVAGSKKTKTVVPAESKKKHIDEFFMSYLPTEKISEERGYAIDRKGSRVFAEQASRAILDLASDEPRAKRSSRGNDERGGNAHKPKMFKTDSGALLPASYKSDRYEKWQKKTHLSLPRIGEPELNSERRTGIGAPKKRWHTKAKSASKRKPAGKSK